MISQYTKDLIKNHGFEFIPSHDRMGNAVPDEWRHEETNISFYSIEEVLEFISNSTSDIITDDN